MIDQAIETIEKYNMLSFNDKVLVGLSGGPDSLALVHILLSLKENYKVQLFAAHINHNLRGEESDKDQEFVEEICKKWGIPLFVHKADIKELSKQQKISIEEAGRIERYNFFNQILDEIGGQKIAVAHNANDNAETIMMRVLRGTGIEGLCGIKPVRDNVIRPLINIYRGQIEEYCRSNDLFPRIDSSNLDNKYTRNKIRMDLLPYIQKEFNPNIIEALNRMGNLLNAENIFLTSQVNDILNEVIIKQNEEYISINLDKINKQPIFIIPRIIRSIIERLNGSISGFESINISDAIDFINNAKTGSIFNLPKGIILKKSYNQIIFDKRKILAAKKYLYKINIPGQINLDETNSILKISVIENKTQNISQNKNIQTFDYDKIHGELVVRSRLDGDIFAPMGMKGTKKLKEYFIDQKIPKEERDNIPLVACGKEIIWIIGLRPSEKYKVDEETKKILVIEYIRDLEII